MRCIVLLVVLFFACATWAEDMNYNFVNLGYQNLTSDAGPFDVDGDGLSIDASIAITPSVHLSLGAGQAEFDYPVSGFGQAQSTYKTESTELSAGIGFNTPVGEAVDFVAEASFVRADFDSDLFPSTNFNGYVLGLGLRGKAGEKVELGGLITYADVTRASETGLSLSGIYYPAPNWGIGASYRVLERDLGLRESAFSIGLRFNFSR